MKNKGILSLFLALLLLMGTIAPAFAAAAVTEVQLDMAAPTVTAAAKNTRGNSTGNAIAYSIAAQEGTKLFFAIPGELATSGIYTMGATNGSASQAKLLRKGNYMELQAIGGYLYFGEYYNKGYYRMKQDGSGFQKISDDALNYVNIIGSWIYYKCTDGGNADFGKLIRMKTDGSARKVISQDEVGAVNAYSDVIYYMNLSDGQKPYSVKPDGTGRKKVSDTAMFRPCFAEDGFVYYTDYASGELYRAKYNGSGKKKLTDGDTAFPNYRNGYLYYRQGGDTYRMKSGTSKAEKLVVGTSGSDDVLAVLDNFVLRYDAETYPRVSVYSISKKTTEVVPKQPARATATVNSVRGEFWYTTPIDPWGRPGQSYLSGGKVYAAVTATKAGLLTIEYGFGQAAQKYSVTVKKGKTYDLTFEVTGYSSSGTISDGFTVRCGDSSKVTQSTVRGQVSYGAVTCVERK